MLPGQPGFRSEGSPVLVSALVFLLKTGSVVLHSAAPPARRGLLSVCGTKPRPKFHHDICPHCHSKQSQCVRVQLERLSSCLSHGHFAASTFLGVSWKSEVRGQVCMLELLDDSTLPNWDLQWPGVLGTQGCGSGWSQAGLCLAGGYSL